MTKATTTKSPTRRAKPTHGSGAQTRTDTKLAPFGDATGTIDRADRVEAGRALR